MDNQNQHPVNNQPISPLGVLRTPPYIMGDPNSKPLPYTPPNSPAKYYKNIARNDYNKGCTEVCDRCASLCTYEKGHLMAHKCSTCDLIWANHREIDAPPEPPSNYYCNLV